MENRFDHHSAPSDAGWAQTWLLGIAQLSRKLSKNGLRGDRAGSSVGLDIARTDFVAFVGGKGISRQKSAADTVAKHHAVRQDLSSPRFFTPVTICRKSCIICRRHFD